MKLNLTKVIAIAFVVTAFFTSCSNDDDNVQEIVVTVNGQVLFENGGDFNGDVDASFTGNGGSDTRVFNWQNNLTTADYNADITATSEGTFRMIVRDADEMIVLDRMLDGAVEPDSFSGVTDAGTSGIWTVTIEVANFNGDGSFSLSEGN